MSGFGLCRARFLASQGKENIHLGFLTDLVACLGKLPRDNWVRAGSRLASVKRLVLRG